MLSNICRHATKHVILTIPDVSCLLRRKSRFGKKFGNQFHELEFKEQEKSKPHDRKALECGCENIKIDNEEQNYGLPYDFTLKDSVGECEEYIIHTDVLIKKFESHGLKMIEHKNFINFFNDNYKDYRQLHDRMVRHLLTEEELDVVRIYCVLVFERG